MAIASLISQQVTESDQKRPKATESDRKRPKVTESDRKRPKATAHHPEPYQITNA